MTKIFDFFDEGENKEKTAVMIALLTDSAVTKDEKRPDDLTPHNGWWADPSLGSRLWLLRRTAQVKSNLIFAKIYAERALKALVEDKIIDSFRVSTRYDGPALVLDVTITKGKEEKLLVLPIVEPAEQTDYQLISIGDIWKEEP